MMQKRLELIPHLIDRVNAFVAQEKDMMLRLTKLRQLINSPSLTEQNQLSKDLSSLFAVAENYPQLRSNQNFLQLQ